jgi:hypothetical protein
MEQVYTVNRSWGDYDGYAEEPLFALIDPIIAQKHCDDFMEIEKLFSKSSVSYCFAKDHWNIDNPMPAKAAEGYLWSDTWGSFKFKENLWIKKWYKEYMATNLPPEYSEAFELYSEYIKFELAISDNNFYVKSLPILDL